MDDLESVSYAAFMLGAARDSFWPTEAKNKKRMIWLRWGELFVGLETTQPHQMTGLTVL